MAEAENVAEGNLDVKIHRRFFKDDAPGRVFVEVGAARPDYLSLSARFRKLGWRVVAVEPNPEFCELHRRKGYDVLQYACGDHDEDDVDFTVVDSNGAEYRGGNVSFESFSSLGIKEPFAKIKPNLPTKTIKVRLRKLDTILKEHAPDVERIDILAIDVEGWELEVMNGFSLERYRPRCVVLENLFADPAYVRRMTERGYRLWRTLPPNQTFVAPDVSVPALERLAYRAFDAVFHRYG